MFFQDFVLDAVSKATLLLALVSLLDLSLRRTASAALRHRLWATTFIALLLLPVLSATVPHWHLSVLPAQWQQLQQRPAQTQLPAETWGTLVSSGRLVRATSIAD